MAAPGYEEVTQDYVGTVHEQVLDQACHHHNLNGGSSRILLFSYYMKI